VISHLKWLLLFAVLVVCPVTDANASSISKACETALNSRLKGWQLATVSKDVAEWAKLNKFSPVIGFGDFDGDGRKDEAILVQHAGQRKVAVCLATANGLKLITIKNLYCDDYLSISKAKSKHNNFDTEKTEVIKNDGISVTCFERAGATYLYNGQAFRELVDSD
jgi:hypothetical protein